MADEQAGVHYLLNEFGGDVEAFTVGFGTHNEHLLLEATPNLIIRIGKEYALIEVKNRYLTRRQKIKLDSPYLDSNLKLKRNHCFFYQVQAAMLCAYLKKCYFVVHGEKKKYESIELNKPGCEIMIAKAKQFFEK